MQKTHPLLRPINATTTALIRAGVWVYRYTLGLFIGGQCRFQPTCSQYMLDAIDKHGPWRGGYRGIKRILRCHPWSEGGVDEP